MTVSTCISGADLRKLPPVRHVPHHTNGCACHHKLSKASWNLHTKASSYGVGKHQRVLLLVLQSADHFAHCHKAHRDPPISVVSLMQTTLSGCLRRLLWYLCESEGSDWLEVAL